MLRDGSRVETRGAWSVDGRLLVFELPDGTLVSMAARDVDLEASERLTEALEARRREAAAPAKVGEKEEPKPKATFVVTDADVGHVDPAAGRAGDAAADEAAEEAPRLVVVDWQRLQSGDREIVRGKIRNTSDLVATAVAVSVQGLDREGALLATHAARMTSSALIPGAEADFEVELDSSVAYTRLAFDLDADFFAVGSEPQ